MVIVKGDFHCHTIYSDGLTKLEDLTSRAKKFGFDILTKADHNTTKGNKELKLLAEKEGMIFIPSLEISTKEGHLVAINIDNWDRKLGGKTMQEQIDIVLNLGGIPVVAHPYWRGGLGAKIFDLNGALGYELMNHSSPFGTRRLIKESANEPEKYSKFAKYSGSDSHGNAAYGYYYNEINAASKAKEDIIEALFKQHVTPRGPNLFKNLALFFKDGIPNQIAQLKRQISK